MISWVHRRNLDEEKYDYCISNSQQSLTYAYSWYLDIVCDHWSVLVLNDYQAVMPIPFRKKYLINYVYPPLWMLQLGIFSQVKDFSQEDFTKALKRKFRFIELRLNSNNLFNDKNFEERHFQELSMKGTMENLREGYQSDRLKDLKKSKKFGLVAKWNDTPEQLITLFQENVGQRTPEIKTEDYANLKTLINTCIEKNAGEILSVYQNEQLVASGFFLKHKETVTILCSSTDFKNRKNGANTFLIDMAIQKYRSDYKIFNFGGSSMKGIARYFLSFGAKDVIYPFLRRKPI